MSLRAPQQRKVRALLGAALALWALSGLAAVPARATLVVPDLNWDGGNPGGDPTNFWSADIGSGDWSLTGGVVQSSPFSSSYPELTGAYDFDGVDDVAELDSTFKLLLPGSEKKDLSFELWIRPDSLSGGGQVLFEVGTAAQGLSVTLNDADLLFRVKDASSISLSHDLTSVDVAEFIHIAALVDFVADEAWLYVNGTEVGNGTAGDIKKWGADQLNETGLGGMDGAEVGADLGDLGGYGGFAGEIAILRFYSDYVLSPSEVYGNYTHVAGVPEPSTDLLLAAGLVGLAAIGRRRPRRCVPPSSRSGRRARGG